MSAAHRARCAVAVVVTMVCSPAPARADMPVQLASPSVSVAAIVDEAARRFSIPQGWIYAVMRVESGGQPRAVSQKGAAGLMQIMPRTWDRLRVRYGFGTDIFDARDNVMAGAAYLREMHDRYGSPGFLAAYNAGPGRYEEYLSTGRPLPAETIAYVGKLAPLIDAEPVTTAQTLPPDPRAWMRAALFAGDLRRSGDHASDVPPESLSPASSRTPSAPAVPARAGLFVPLSGPSAR